MTKRIIDRLPDLRLAEGVPVPLRAANLVVGPESMPFVFTPSTRLGSLGLNCPRPALVTETLGLTCEQVEFAAKILLGPRFCGMGESFLQAF
jgi:hypothetical protein